MRCSERERESSLGKENTIAHYIVNALNAEQELPRNRRIERQKKFRILRRLTAAGLEIAHLNMAPAQMKLFIDEL